MRRILAAAYAVTFFLCAPVVACGGATVADLTPADHLEIVADQAAVRAKLDECERLGRRIGPDGGLAAYRACVHANGLSDGGAP